MRFLLLALLAGLSSPALAAAVEASPGLWEVTTTVAVPKLPFGLKVPGNLPIPRSGTRATCVREKDLARPHDLVKAQTGCSLQDWQEAGEEVSWKVSCDRPPRSRSTGRLTFEGDTLQGTATVVTAVQGFELPVSMRYTGRRVGDCP